MDRDLDLSLLRTFFTIAMTGSFTATGHRLFRTQPAISLRIKRLEDIIGFPLVTRSTDGVALTREGNLLLGYAKRILSLNDEAMRRIRVAGTCEVVRIGLPEEYTAISIEKVLKGFAADCPAASLIIEVKVSGDLDNCLQEGRLDVIVSACLAEPADSMTGRRVPVVWVASEQAALPRLGEIRLVLPAEGNLYRRIALSALAKVDVAWDIACTATNWSMAKSAVLAGMGVSVVSLDMVTPGMRLVGKEDGLPPLPEMRMSLLCRSRPPSAAVQRLTELLGESLRDAGGRMGTVPVPALALVTAPVRETSKEPT
jgi:DNA-binding transcriptional LysR family regulator